MPAASTTYAADPTSITNSLISLCDLTTDRGISYYRVAVVRHEEEQAVKLGRTILTSLLAVSMTSMPVLAQAKSSPAAIARTGTEVSETDAFAGSTMLVAVVVIAGLLFGLLLIDSDSDTPTSP